MSKNRSLSKSFAFAFEGIRQAFKREPNFRIHVLLALVASGAAFYLNFSAIEWIILLFTVATVIIAELINTAVESLVDLVSPDIREEAKLAKDVLAAAVFVSALLAVIVGVLLFLPKLMQLI